jgi:putative Holliday junction resolvase
MFCYFEALNSVLVNKGERLSGASPEFVLIPDNFFFSQILPIFALWKQQLALSPLNIFLLARIMAIDYGGKRTGIAVSDPLQIIATGLDTVPTANLLDFLRSYCQEEDVEFFVVGEPKNLDDTPAQIHHLVMAFVEQLTKLFPEKKVILRDERFTSKDATRSIIQSVPSRKKRRNKGLVDKVSAVIILQEYLEKYKYS